MFKSLDIILLSRLSSVIKALELSSYSIIFYGYFKKKNPIDDTTHNTIITHENATLFTLPRTKADIKFPIT
jgi:hypothetical protein